MLPFYNVFRYQSGSVQFNQIFDSFLSVYFSVYILLLFDIVMFIRYCKNIKIRKQSINVRNLLLLVCLSLCFCFPRTLSQINSSSLSAVITILCLFVSVFLILGNKDVLMVSNIANSWFIGILSSVLMYNFRYILPSLNDYIAKFGGRFSCLSRDPNYMAFEMLVLLMMYTCIFLNQKKYVEYCISFVLLSCLCILSLSKSFIITLIIYCLILIYWIYCKLIFKRHNKYSADYDVKFRFKVIYFIIITILFVLALYLMFQDKLIFIYKRMGLDQIGEKNFTEIMNSLTTGRWSIWKKYIVELFSSPLNFFFGVGVCAGYFDNAVHCTIIQIVYFGGVVGLCMMIFALIMFLKDNLKKSFYNILPLIIVFIMSCSLDLLLSYRTYLIVVTLGMCCMFSSQKEIMNN